MKKSLLNIIFKMCLKSNTLLSILEITDRSEVVHQFFNFLPFVKTRQFIFFQWFLNSTRLQQTSKNKQNKKVNQIKRQVFGTFFTWLLAKAYIKKKKFNCHILIYIELRTKLVLFLLLFMLLVKFVLIFCGESFAYSLLT